MSLPSPIEPSGYQPPGAPASHAKASGLVAKILVVDDDERNAFAATSALEELGHEVVVARSGEEALRRLLHEDFAVILLDLHMPGMDGYETAAYIRERRRSARIPIVFLTAVFRDEAHLFQAYSHGAVDVVFKPIDPFILRSKVQVLVDLHIKTLEVQVQAEHRQRLMDENARVQREKLQAELALRRSQERQQTILKTLPIVVHSRAVEPPHGALFVSDNVEAVTGFTPSEFTSDPAFGMGRVHPEDVEKVGAALKEAIETGAYACEFRWLSKSGEYRRFLDQGILAAGEGGDAEIFGCLLDVTDRRSLEEQLAQARKMESVGQLTGGVAHDFNNLLTVIIGNLDLLDLRNDRDERLNRQHAAIRYAAERGRSLTRQLLAFSRRQHLSPVALEVNGLISNFTPLLQQAVGEAVQVDLQLHKKDLCAEVDPAQLETALLNLAVNARDAMPEGGRLTLATSVKGPDGGKAATPDWICIEVKDTGVGIAPEALEHVFEPFFTTKEVGKGSGLGLSQVYGFVKQSGGQIALQSKPGQGAVFRLFLKASEKPAEKVREGAAETMDPKSKPPFATGGSAKVLVVEDDEDVLSVAVDVLSGLGYDVATASSAAAALKFLKRESVDLLFSDVVMPGGRNGVDLAKSALELRPGLKVLLTSGYVGQPVSWAGHQFDLIDKPYERSTLARRVREVLTNQPASKRRSRGRSSTNGRERSPAEAAG